MILRFTPSRHFAKKVRDINRQVLEQPIQIKVSRKDESCMLRGEPCPAPGNKQDTRTQECRVNVALKKIFKHFHGIHAFLNLLLGN